MNILPLQHSRALKYNGLEEERTHVCMHQLACIRLLLTSMTILIGPFMCGVALGFSSPVSAQLLLPESTLSFFSSIINIGALIGCLVVAPLLTMVGRHITFRISIVPFFIGWFLVAASKDLHPPAESSNKLIFFLLFGRFLTGIGAGMILACGSVYLVELAPPSKRGSIGSSPQLAIVGGICTSYALALNSTWFETANYMIILSLVLSVLSYWLPESPVWLTRTHQWSKSLKILTWLRVDKSIAVYELNSYPQGCTNESDKYPSLWSLIFPCQNIPRKFCPSLKMAIYLMIFQQLTGVNVITFFTESLCQQFVPVSQSAKCAFSLGIAQFVFSCISCIFIDKFSRRLLITATGVIISVSMLVFAVGKQYPNLLPISPIVALFFFLFGYSVGWGPLPMLITMELFPSSHRGAAGGAAVGISWIISFLVTQTFKPIAGITGEFFCFSVFGLITAFATLFFFHKLPETNIIFAKYSTRPAQC